MHTNVNLDISIPQVRAALRAMLDSLDAQNVTPRTVYPYVGASNTSAVVETQDDVDPSAEATDTSAKPTPRVKAKKAAKPEPETRDDAEKPSPEKTEADEKPSPEKTEADEKADTASADIPTVEHTMARVRAYNGAPGGSIERTGEFFERLGVPPSVGKMTDEQRALVVAKINEEIGED